jgi:hypothetical protein
MMMFRGFRGGTLAETAARPMSERCFRPDEYFMPVGETMSERWNTTMCPLER